MNGLDLCGVYRRMVVFQSMVVALIVLARVVERCVYTTRRIREYSILTSCSLYAMLSPKRGSGIL
jgi:hypothetical protein